MTADKVYNFDEIIPREGSNCLKWDAREKIFNRGDILPLWVADMDFRTPDFIIDALKHRLNHEILGYTFRPDSYFEAVIGWMKRRHNWNIRREWISFSPGVVAGLSLAIQAFSKPGDSIIVQPPVYFPFFDCVRDADRRLIENPLREKAGRYHFDLDDLKSKLDENTRMLLLCSPQNPGGTVWSEEELNDLMTLCLERDILIVSDEIHSDLVFRHKKHIPLASLSEAAARQTVTLTAASKTFNIAGLASSVVIIPDREKWLRYEKTLQTMHLGNGNLFGNIAMESAFSHGDSWLDQLLDYVWNNFLYLRDYLETRIPAIKVMEPDGTYLVWLDIRDLGMNDHDLHDFFVQQAGLGLNPGTRFGPGGEGRMRINIACPRSLLEQALNSLDAAISKYNPK